MRFGVANVSSHRKVYGVGVEVLRRGRTTNTLTVFATRVFSDRLLASCGASRVATANFASKLRYILAIEHLIVLGASTRSSLSRRQVLQASRLSNLKSGRFDK